MVDEAVRRDVEELQRTLYGGGERPGVVERVGVVERGQQGIAERIGRLERSVDHLVVSAIVAAVVAVLSVFAHLVIRAVA